MCLSRSQSPGDLSSPESELNQEEITFHPLVFSFVHDDCYWPQPGSCQNQPILISTNLLLTGGFVTGLKLAANPRLLIVFVDEKGRMFEGRYGSHRPWRVLCFFPRRFVRLRLFGSDFFWRPLEKLFLEDSSYRAHVAIAVTDSEGQRHHFAFSAVGEIRGLFPTSQRR